MTTSQIIAIALGWTAAAVSIAAFIGARRQAARRERDLPVYDDAVITFPRRMSDADVQAFKARWQQAHGTPPHPGRVIDGQVCPAYRVPKTAEDSGLCARCGMYDYKHQETTHG